MYGYVDRVFSIDDVLKRISQEEIFEYILGYRPEANIYVVSPIRNDNKPGAFFEWYNGRLYFVDFADPDRINRDCFQVLMDIKGIKLHEATREIIEHFDLSSKQIIFPDIDKTLRSKKANNRDITSKQERLFTEISFKSRSFSNRDKEFWYDTYGITKSQLTEDNVFPIVWYKFYSEKRKEWIVIRPDDICYAYAGFGRGKVKIYRPYCRNHRGKWLTNCDENDIGGIHQLPFSGRQLLIQKSYKDGRVIRNEGATSVWFQNETMMPDFNTLLSLCGRFSDIPIWYDNDRAGIAGATKIAALINERLPGRARPIWLPEGYPKDPSDMLALRKGKELQHFLTANNIIYSLNPNPDLHEVFPH